MDLVGGFGTGLPGLTPFDCVGGFGTSLPGLTPFGCVGGFGTGLGKLLPGRDLGIGFFLDRFDGGGDLDGGCLDDGGGEVSDPNPEGGARELNDVCTNPGGGGRLSGTG